MKQQKTPQTKLEKLGECLMYGHVENNLPTKKPTPKQLIKMFEKAKKCTHNYMIEYIDDYTYRNQEIILGYCTNCFIYVQDNTTNHTRKILNTIATYRNNQEFNEPNN